MLARARRLVVSRRPFCRLLFASILIFALMLSLVVTTGPAAFASSSLLDRARLAREAAKLKLITEKHSAPTGSPIPAS